MSDRDREYERENYKLEHDITRFYDRIIDARLETSKALSHYKAAEKNIGNLGVEEELNAQSKSKTVFKHHLDRYYDLVGNKFDKADKASKPDFVKDKEKEDGYFTPHELSMEKAIKLYKELNQLLEDLEITSMEQLDQGRRRI